MIDFYCEYALKNIDALDVVYESESMLAAQDVARLE
jgi:hypothetical protein